MRLVKTNSHLFPGMGEVGIYFDWASVINSKRRIAKISVSSSLELPVQTFAYS